MKIDIALPIMPSLPFHLQFRFGCLVFWDSVTNSLKIHNNLNYLKKRVLTMKMLKRVKYSCKAKITFIKIKLP